MKGKLRQYVLLGLFAGLFLVSVADELWAAEVVFQAMDDFTSQFSSYIQSRLARTLGLIGVAGLMITAIVTRGHGMEIAIAAVLLGVGLAFMFGADRIFAFFGYAG